MHNAISREKIERIHRLFAEKISWAKTNRNADVMEDGILDLDRYENAPIRILWILKQDYYSGDDWWENYATRLRAAIVRGNLSPTWKRMSYVSYGIQNEFLGFNDLPSACECADALLQTAVIEVDKELGESLSPDGVILDGYKIYWPIVREQILAYDPDVIIVGMTGAQEALRVVPEAVFKLFNPTAPYLTYGSLRERTKIQDKELLWVCHPAVTSYDGLGISDELYYESIVASFRDSGLTPMRKQ